MPEPREEDDIALGLDEEESEDETYDTLEEKYADQRVYPMLQYVRRTR